MAKLTEELNAPNEESFEFVQVECGTSHTLLLNKRGDVFSFG
jgi:alpha-tubulin suppressor-like RCC1 family protein